MMKPLHHHFTFSREWPRQLVYKEFWESQEKTYRMLPLALHKVCVFNQVNNEIKIKV